MKNEDLGKTESSNNVDVEVWSSFTQKGTEGLGIAGKNKNDRK